MKKHVWFALILALTLNCIAVLPFVLFFSRNKIVKSEVCLLISFEEIQTMPIAEQEKSKQKKVESDKTHELPHQTKKSKSKKTVEKIVPFYEMEKGLELLAPTYPEQALKFGLEASINIRIFINSDGRVVRMEILGNNKPNQVFIDVISEAVKSWEFTKIGEDIVRVSEKELNFRIGEDVR